ncbi:hypothetical protein [Halobacteriaceae bacterium SHR40]|uniref:hypothetical protein n=1 Tax=Halovenus amylolytica TaxID=2500550 RepID=UPI000FE2D46E
MSRHPIEGQIVLLAGAQASVTLERLSELLAEVQPHLRAHRERYERNYERIDADENVYHLVDTDHWEQVGDELDLDQREIDAVRRTHEAQFTRDGRRLNRKEEFETALSIRTPVVMKSKLAE